MSRTADTALSRRSILLGGMLVGASAMAAAFQVRMRSTQPIARPLGKELPMRVGPWLAADTDDLVRPAEPGKKERYDQEVSRVFLSEEQPGVMLLIAYGTTQSDTLQVHRPEFCYPAAGFEISGTQKVDLPVANGRVVPSTFFTAVRGDRVEQVLYWVRLGDAFPNSWLRQHLVRLADNAKGILPDGILVRASVLDAHAAQSRTMLSNFLSQLAATSSPVGRLALLGQP